MVFFEKKMFEKVVQWCVLWQETSFRRAMRPASDNSLMEGAMAKRARSGRKMSYTVACPLISGIAACGFGLIESFKHGYLVAWFVGRYFGREREL